MKSYPFRLNNRAGNEHNRSGVATCESTFCVKKRVPLLFLICVITECKGEVETLSIKAVKGSNSP